jgi:hypothetical protein
MGEQTDDQPRRLRLKARDFLPFPEGDIKFVLPVHGTHLSNRIIGKLDPPSLADSYSAIRELEKRSKRRVIVVDQTGIAAGKCFRVCEMPRPWGCMAQRLAF